jgi:hypothetical protein
MAYTRALKYRYVQQVQSAASALAKAYRMWADLASIGQTRAWGDGAADAIVAADINPDDPAIGSNLGITPTQVFSIINYGFTSLDALMKGTAVTTYPLGASIGSVRNDI